MRMYPGKSASIALLALFATRAALAGPQSLDTSRMAPEPKGQVAVGRPADTSSPARSQDAAGSIGDSVVGLPAIDGPAAPTGPDVIHREGAKATMRAFRIDRPLDVDGRLDDHIYETLAPAGNFIQQLPKENTPATEPTEVWVMFDDRNLYIAIRCYDSRPEREVATELRRDHNNILQGDNVTVVLDTFYDRRNAYFFQTNPIAALRDQLLSNGQPNVNWNTVWDVRAGHFDKGWTIEMAIPFKSLRYRGSGPQVWGINFRRIVKWRNEVSLLTGLPASFGQAGVYQMGSAGTLVGLETPPAAMNLDLKPYALSSLLTDRVISQPYSNKGELNAGLDLKYALTSSLAADVTLNTDFAQVEEDLQQVNLTRFSLQFPEKRDFFLEGQGTFTFGRGGGDIPTVFFSRRIGLNNGLSVPVIAGGRVTGKAGKFDVGALNIQTAEKAEARAVSTNFTALRVKRDILRRSFIGLIATQRSPTTTGTGKNYAVGADMDFRLSDEVTALGYYALTRSDNSSGDESSYRGSFAYSADRYGFDVEHLKVGDNFNPAVGFVRRPDLRRSSGGARFSPRLRSSKLVRRLSFVGSLDYLTDAKTTVLENRSLAGNFDMEFHSSDAAGANYNRDYERLPARFTISPGVVVPAGSYLAETVSGSYTLGLQRPVSGTVSGGRGSFYGGTRTQASYSGRLGVNRFSVEPSISLNWVNLPFGDFTARLFSTRFILTPSPLMSLAGLLQVNPSNHTMSASARLRWEYNPGSELFVVYSDGRSTGLTSDAGWSLLNRSVVVKVTRLMRL